MYTCALLLFSVLAATSSSCSGQSLSGNNREHGAFLVEPSVLLSADTVPAMERSILNVFQASSGHYWFGSDTQGIFRYDGKAIVHFTFRGGHPANRVWEIQEDGAGNIFITTLAGVVKYDGRAFAALPVADGASTQDWKLAAGDLWFREKHSGVYRYDGEQLYHLEFPKSPMEDAYYARNPGQSWSPYEVYTMYKDRHGALWLGTVTFGFYRFDGTSLHSIYEQQMMETPEGGWFASRAILEDRKGKFWINNTRYRYDISGDAASHDTTLLSYKREVGIEGYGGDSALYFLSIVEDEKGDLWMATYSQGVWRYDGKKMTQYRVMDGDKPTTVFSIYKDRRGDLWLGTHSSGAYKFNGQAFEKFRP